MIVVESNKTQARTELTFKDSNAIFEDLSLANLTAFTERDMLELNLNSLSLTTKGTWSSTKDAIKYLINIRANGQLSFMFRDLVHAVTCSCNLKFLLPEKNTGHSSGDDFFQLHYSIDELTSLSESFSQPIGLAKLGIDADEFSLTVSYDLSIHQIPSVQFSFTNTPTAASKVSIIIEKFLQNEKEELIDSLSGAVKSHLDRSW